MCVEPWVAGAMTVTDPGIVLGAQRIAQERDARASAAAALRRGATWTATLMILPGLLSSRPVENSLTGAVAGLSATLLIALGRYAWRRSRQVDAGAWWPNGTASR